MTITKLAALSGFSVSTVSKAFSHSPEISEITREHIFRIAKEQGCYEKYVKKAYHAPVIAVLVPEFQSRYYAPLLSFLEKEVRARGGILLATSSNFVHEEQKTLLTYFAEYAKVDGMIVFSHTSSYLHAIPTVSVGMHPKLDSVCLSETSAMEEAVSLLIKQGHRQIAFLGERHTTSRMENFQRVMRKFRLPVSEDLIYCSEKRFEAAGYEGMQSFLSQENRPTAVFAAYDNIAVGAMHAIQEAGLSIPEDISLVGIDDIAEDSFLTPSLASISHCNEDLAQVVVDLLFERMEKGANMPRRQINISAEFVPRASIGKAKDPSFI